MNPKPDKLTPAPIPFWQPPSLGTVAKVFWVGWAYFFLLAPMAVVIGSSFDGTTAYSGVVFPPQELTWKWYQKIPSSHYQSLGLSLGLALSVALGACLLGIPAALAIVRGKLPGKSFFLAFFRAPMQIPAVVTGVAFLRLYYVAGDATGLYLNATFVGLYLGHLFVATPYVIGTVVSVLQRFNMRLEEAALSMGASRWSTFRRITLPTIMPGVHAGALYAFMVSFSDVPIAMFLTAPGFVTYPVELFFGIETDFNPSVLASASLVIVFSLVALLLVQKVIGLDSVVHSGNSR
jgi:putative spermidine/putrescine transport system permease protein